MGRLFRIIAALFLLVAAHPALAEVTLSFHSFNGSVVVGRYPHTFVVMQGTLEDGTRINENYGFSAKRAGPAVLRGPVEHVVMTEKQKYIASTNRHFSVTIDDAKYWAIRREVDRWRNAPGKYYDLDTRNCIHFVGEIARMVGIRVTYPEDMLRLPKKWLNHLTAMNPQLGAKQVA